MSDSTKQTRKEIYAALNFGGSTEWAIDLESFVADFDGQEKVYYSEESDWATHPCNDPAVNNSLSDGGPRWNAAGCDAAWADFLTSWNGNPHSSSFSNELSNYFHGPPNWDCGVISALDSSCGDTTQCNNVDKFPPAAQFIMDSLALIQQVSIPSGGTRHFCSGDADANMRLLSSCTVSYMPALQPLETTSPRS